MLQAPECTEGGAREMALVVTMQHAWPGEQTSALGAAQTGGASRSP